MTSHRKLLIFPALGMAAALVWTVAGGMTVAHGQEKPFSIHRAHDGTYRKPFGKPIFILALGSDSGAPAYGRGGTPESGRADSIHIIAINPQLKKATLVGIPRDSYVQLACGGKNKINAGMFFGGAKCMIDTIEALSGGRLKFDYYMVGGFSGLENAINDIGGIPVNVDRGDAPGTRSVLTDSNSRSEGLRTGPNILNGHYAVAYSRNRHDYARGDFNRSVHQGQVMIGALTKARSLVDTDPGKTLVFLRAILRGVKTDIPVVDALHLGLLALQLKPADVKNVLLDGTTGTTDAGSSVLLTNPQAVLANVADDAIIN